MSNPEDRSSTDDRLNENTGGEGSNNDNNPADTTTQNSNENVPRSNVTVRIQYQYFTPEGLTEMNNNNATAAGGDSNPGSTDPTTIHNAGISPSVGTTPRLASLTNNNATESPDLILSFQDVPLTSPERLNSFITIAAELAMRRFQELMNRPKGITREAFEGLPVIRIEELPDKENSNCSICYEHFEDEPVKKDDENNKKRTRETSIDMDEEDREDNASVNKLQRTGSETPSSYVTAMSTNNIADNERTTIPSILNPEVNENNHAEPTRNNENETTNDRNVEQEDMEEPVYQHSPTELPCHHIFGRSCLYQWTRLENTCPLCRKVIIENNENERQQNNEGSSNMEAFEAIRRMLYNTTGANQTDSPSATPTTEGNPNTASTNPETSASQSANTPNPIGQQAEGVSSVPLGGFQPRPVDGSTPNNNATISRTSIIFLRPMSSGEMPQLGSNNAPMGQIPPGILPPRATNTARTPMHIQWMPISLINPATNSPDNVPPEQNHRLRTIFDHIFSASGSANTVDTPVNSENNQEGNQEGSQTATQNQETNNSTPRNAFFSAMSRIAGRLRPSQNNNTSSLNTNNDSQPSQGTSGGSLRDTIARALNERRKRTNTQTNDLRDGLFSAGVGSFRNQDGRVSTFPINHNNPLHFTPNTNQNNDQATNQVSNDNREQRVNDSSNEENVNEEQRMSE